MLLNMTRIGLNKTIKNKDLIGFNLLMLYFKDEMNNHFIYSPHLDLTGYGISLAEAKKSFEIVLNDFLDYTIENNTLHSVLISLGWNSEGNSGLITPGIEMIISQNEHVAELFNKYSVKTYHQTVQMPNAA